MVMKASLYSCLYDETEAGFFSPLVIAAVLPFMAFVDEKLSISADA